MPDTESVTQTEPGTENETEADTDVGFDRSTWMKIGVGFVAAAILLYLFGTVIGWSEILDTLGRASLWWIALACLSSAVCLIIWAKSWDVILDLLGVEIPFRSLVPTYFAATFADYVTPFGKAGGGPFIAYVLSTDERANYQESLAGVVTADLLNLLPFFTFAGIGFVALALTGSIPPNTTALVYGLAMLAFLIPVLIYLSWRKETLVERFVVRLATPVAERTDRVSLESLRDRIDEFYRRIDVISDRPKLLGYTLVFAYVGWMFFAAPLFLAGKSIGVPLDPLLVLFIVPASTLAGISPTPGGLGGVEAAIVALLVGLTPTAPATAAAIALLYRVASYWFVVLVSGLAALYEVYSH
jgi:hypothetical protein